LQEALRVGRYVVASFPNFGHWKARLQLLFTGRAPVTSSLPYQWYNTPNIHLFTLHDFEQLCRCKHIDILQRTGVKVVWRDNNSGSKGVAERVTYEDFSKRKDAQFCSDNNCYDEVLLDGLDDLIRNSQGDMLIVLHIKGSHGPSYYKRSPADLKVFTPECTQDNVQDCPRQTIVNAYDNTIVYTDYLLGKIIDLLQAQNSATAMLYLSDHGESLGENGIYLHGLPYALAPKEQTHVPMQFWASTEFLDGRHLDRSTLHNKRNAPYSHDYLIHSLLGLFNVRTSIYRRDLDLFSSEDRHLG